MVWVVVLGGAITPENLNLDLLLTNRTSVLGLFLLNRLSARLEDRFIL